MPPTSIEDVHVDDYAPIGSRLPTVEFPTLFEVLSMHQQPSLIWTRGSQEFDVISLFRPTQNAFFRSIRFV